METERQDRSEWQAKLGRRRNGFPPSHCWTDLHKGTHASKAGVKNLPSGVPSAKMQQITIKLSGNELSLVFPTHLLKCYSIVQFKWYKTVISWAVL